MGQANWAIRYAELTAGAGLAAVRSMPRGLALMAAVLAASPAVFAQAVVPEQGPPVGGAAAQPLAPAATAQPTTPISSPSPTSTFQPSPAPRISTGLVTIESDQQRADQLTGVVTATGNVRIIYPDERVVATARQAQYFSKENRVVLSGDVDIVQEGGNLIRAERVVYLVDGERLIAIPPSGEQVFSRLKIQRQQPVPAATAPTQPASAPAQPAASPEQPASAPASSGPEPQS